MQITAIYSYFYDMQQLIYYLLVHIFPQSPSDSSFCVSLPSCRALDVGLLRLKIQRRLQLHAAQGAQAVLRLGAETRLRLQQHVHEAVRPVAGADAEIPQSSQPGR